MPKDVLEWIENTGLVVAGVGIVVTGLVMFADEASGAGVLNDPVAVGFFTKAAEFFKKAFASCPALN